MVTVVYVYNSILKTSFIVNFLQYFFRYLETFKPDIFMVAYMSVIYLLIVNDCEKKIFFTSYRRQWSFSYERQGDALHHQHHCVKSARIWSYSAPHLSRIFPHSDWIWRDTPYLFIYSPNAAKCGKSADHK